MHFFQVIRRLTALDSASFTGDAPDRAIEKEQPGDPQECATPGFVLGKDFGCGVFLPTY
jgi:hypothetical protein